MLFQKFENIDGGILDVLDMLQKDCDQCPDKGTESAYKIIVVALLSTILRCFKVGLILLACIFFLFLLFSAMQ